MNNSSGQTENWFYDYLKKHGFVGLTEEERKMLGIVDEFGLVNNDDIEYELCPSAKADPDECPCDGASRSNCTYCQDLPIWWFDKK